mmetsp:Transcript_71414/g.149119  ORF Transcript_71414/g.149119 Transcript_71414/m.149119 type:complete len:261 (+) Transcript_71414:1243-2025(+)
MEGDYGQDSRGQVLVEGAQGLEALRPVLHQLRAEGHDGQRQPPEHQGGHPLQPWRLEGRVVRQPSQVSRARERAPRRDALESPPRGARPRRRLLAAADEARPQGAQHGALRVGGGACRRRLVACARAGGCGRRELTRALCWRDLGRGRVDPQGQPAHPLLARRGPGPDADAAEHAARHADEGQRHLASSVRRAAGGARVPPAPAAHGKPGAAVRPRRARGARRRRVRGGGARRGGCSGGGGGGGTGARARGRGRGRRGGG